MITRCPFGMFIRYMISSELALRPVAASLLDVNGMFTCITTAYVSGDNTITLNPVFIHKSL
jgi:hypothetical protein